MDGSERRATTRTSRTRARTYDTRSRRGDPDGPARRARDPAGGAPLAPAHPDPPENPPARPRDAKRPAPWCSTHQGTGPARTDHVRLPHVLPIDHGQVCKSVRGIRQTPRAHIARERRERREDRAPAPVAGPRPERLADRAVCLSHQRAPEPRGPPNVPGPALPASPVEQSPGRTGDRASEAHAPSPTTAGSASVPP